MGMCCSFWPTLGFWDWEEYSEYRVKRHSLSPSIPINSVSWFLHVGPLPFFAFCGQISSLTSHLLWAEVTPFHVGLKLK